MIKTGIWALLFVLIFSSTVYAGTYVSKNNPNAMLQYIHIRETSLSLAEGKRHSSAIGNRDIIYLINDGAFGLGWDRFYLNGQEVKNMDALADQRYNEAMIAIAESNREVTGWKRVLCYIWGYGTIYSPILALIGWLFIIMLFVKYPEMRPYIAAYVLLRSIKKSIADLEKKGITVK